MTTLSTKHFALAASFALGALFACNNPENAGTTDGEKTDKDEMRAVATLEGTNPDTLVSGSVVFEQDGDKVEMELEISIPSMANKTVAVHIHENGACGDMGKAAGGHWNPTNQNHGQWGKGNFHLGDIGNIQLDGSGNGKFEMETDLWGIGGDANKDVLNKGIIVHSGTDDFTSQPAGNAGSRIACGVIAKKASKEM